MRSSAVLNGTNINCCRLAGAKAPAYYQILPTGHFASSLFTPSHFAPTFKYATIL